jgi:hypothetical protein
MPPVKVKKRFGQLAIERGFVTVDQIIEAFTIQARESIEMRRCRAIGEILLDLGYISTQQISMVLQGRFEPRFGDIATSRRFITLPQLIEAMTVQVRDETEKGTHRLLGEILIELGFMTGNQVKQVLEAMKRNR